MCPRAESGTSATLGAPLDRVYTTVRARAAFGAKIIVLGYPHVFTGASCFGTLGISSTEETKANALADALDQVIGAHATADGVTYKSAIGALNLFNTGESYHPNRNGDSAGYLPLVTSVTG